MNHQFLDYLASADSTVSASRYAELHMKTVSYSHSQVSQSNNRNKQVLIDLGAGLVLMIAELVELEGIQPEETSSKGLQKFDPFLEQLLVEKTEKVGKKDAYPRLGLSFVLSVSLYTLCNVHVVEVSGNCIHNSRYPYILDT